MKTVDAAKYFENISNEMSKNRDKLIELDAVFGDGDLGVTMDEGFKALANFSKEEKEADFGKYFMKGAHVFNEAAPSSLGTIVSFIFMGMAKHLKGKDDINVKDFAEAVAKGEENVMTKAESKVGEKTILDALDPAVKVLVEETNSDKNSKQVLFDAATAAQKGADSTVDMVAVHGRAAYHGEKTKGHMDGGALMIALLFKALAE